MVWAHCRISSRWGHGAQAARVTSGSPIYPQPSRREARPAMALQGDMNGGLLHLRQQGEVIVARKPGGLEVVADDEDGDISVSRDNYRPGDAPLHIGTVAALLPDELKPGSEEDGFHRAPMLRGEFGHGRGYTSARQERCSKPSHAGPRHSRRTRRY